VAKAAISVTLRNDNLTWLRGRVRADQARSVSDLLDQLVTEARALGGNVRSVVGTIDVDSSDPLLLKADEALRAVVASSIGRPFVVKEARASYVRPARKGTRRV